MKKFATILVALIYISITSGIVISTHYCMGEVSTIAIGTSDNESCATCGMKNDGCCHDDLQVIQLKVDHNYSVLHFDFPVLAPLSQTWEVPSAEFVNSEHSLGVIKNHSPPSSVPLFIRNCVYRI